MRKRRIQLLWVLFAIPLSGCLDECPEGFPGGTICGPDGNTIQSCQHHECFEGPICYEGWFLSESSCPAIAPNCVEDVPGSATCIGEIIGTCSMAGIVACEDTFTEIRCGDDGRGNLALQRGACAPGARCSVDSVGGASGCDPKF